MPDSSLQELPPASPPLDIASTQSASDLSDELPATSETGTSSWNELPAPPFHILPSLPNFRDIGGWPVLSRNGQSKHFRTNLIFRGPDTTRISPDDIAALQNLGITTDYDLRSAGQIARLGFRDLGEYGIRRIWLPVFNDDNEKVEEEGVRRRYEQYASDDVSDIVSAFISTLTSGAHVLATILRDLLSSNPPSPIFIHCTTGNNRTGPFVAMLLALLHVDRPYIVREYVMSEWALESTRHVNVERLLKKGALKEYGEVEARRKCERMVGARMESMIGLMIEVERRWGGAEEYFREVVGLSEAEVQRVRELLTADGESELSKSFHVGE